MIRKTPKVSLIMPVYNAEKFLDESITSILDQSFDDFEFIIIDDESKDKSWGMIKRYAKKDKRIVALKNEKNLGCVNTRNKGLRIARGKYIAVMDPDDVCLPKRFEIELDYLENHPDIFMVGGSVIVIDEEGKKLGIFLKYENYNQVRKKLLKLDFIFHSSIMYRNTKEFFYREKFLTSDDYDFLLNVLSSGKKIIDLPEFLIKYRINQSSVTSTRTNQKFFFLKAKEFYKQRITTGKDNYEHLKSPNQIITVNPQRRKLEIIIIAEFQDNQMKKVRKDIIKYIKNYGFYLPFVGYYILSFLPTKIYKLLRQKI